MHFSENTKVDGVHFLRTLSKRVTYARGIIRESLLIGSNHSCREKRIPPYTSVFLAGLNHVQSQHFRVSRRTRCPR